MRTPSEAIRALKAEFDVAHKEGMAALQRRDYSALHAAIRQEAAIIARQRDAIKQHVRRSERLMAAIDALGVPKTRRKTR